MFLNNKFHRDISPPSGFGTGSLDRRPVLKEVRRLSSDAEN